MKRLVEHIIKGYLLKESLSRIVYHFTGINTLYNILYTNQFHLNSDMYQGCETFSNKPYYMCYTRQFNNNLGYSGKCSVRIHLDGELLNQRFSGKSIDYWSLPYTEYKKKAKEAHAQCLYDKQKDYEDNYNTPTSKTRMQKSNLRSRVENEDRLFSDNPIIDKVTKYIKRIDILINKNIDNNLLQSVKYIAEQRGVVDKLYIFDNQQDFNNPYSKNSITNKIQSSNLVQVPDINYHDIYNVAQFLKGLIIIDDVNQEQIYDYIKFLFDKYDIQIYDINQIVQHIGQNFPSSYIKPDELRELISFCGDINKTHRYKFFQILEYVFKKHNLRNVNDLSKFLNVKKVYNDTISYYDIDHDKTITVLQFIENDYEFKKVFLHPETTPFWSISYFEQRRDDFIEEVTHCVHKPTSEEQIKFKRYITRIANNDNITISKMIEICDLLPYFNEYTDRSIWEDVFGGIFIKRKINYDVCYDSNVQFLNKQEKLEVLKQFVR